MQVLVRDNNVDQALKALKKKMQREGIFREMKLRGHYEKPSEKKAREKAEAVRRARKLARKKLQREGLLPMKPKPVFGAGPGGERGAGGGRGGPGGGSRGACADQRDFEFDQRGPSGPRFCFWRLYFPAWRVTNEPQWLAREYFASMAIPVAHLCSGASRSARAVAIALDGARGSRGCSINLGSLTPSSSSATPEPAKLTSSTNIASLTETIKSHPNDPQAYNMRGSVLAQAGKTDEALADFNKAISLDANYGQAYANRGLIYRQTRRLDQAMADYERAISLDANYAPAYLGRGMVYKARKQPAEALADFNKAITLAPDNAEAYYNRGLLYQAEKQHQYAIDDFTAANGLVPQQARAAAGAGAELSRHRPAEGSGRRSRRGGAGRSAEPAGLADARARL